MTQKAKDIKKSLDNGILPPLSGGYQPTTDIDSNPPNCGSSVQTGNKKGLEHFGIGDLLAEIAKRIQ